MVALAVDRLVRSRRGDPEVNLGRELGAPGLALRGGVIGFVSAIAGTAGPLGNAVFLGLPLSPRAYVASEATATCVIHAAKLAVFGGANLILATDLPKGLGIAAAMVLGTFAGKSALRDVPRARFVTSVSALMVVAGLAMIGQGLHAFGPFGSAAVPE